MFCRKCGYKLTEDDDFCPNCGAAAPETVKPDSVSEPENRDSDPVESVPGVSDTHAMVIGIVSAALASAPGACIASIILGKKAVREAQDYLDANGRYSGKARAGRITGTVGRIVGIVMTVFWALYFTLMTVFFALLMAGALDGFMESRMTCFL